MWIKWSSVSCPLNDLASATKQQGDSHHWLLTSTFLCNLYWPYNSGHSWSVPRRILMGIVGHWFTLFLKGTCSRVCPPLSLRQGKTDFGVPVPPANTSSYLWTLYSANLPLRTLLPKPVLRHRELTSSMHTAYVDARFPLSYLVLSPEVLSYSSSWILG